MSLDRLKRKRAVIEDLAREVCASLSGTSIGWSAAQRAIAAYLAFDIEEELQQDPSHQQAEEAKRLQAQIHQLDSQLKNLMVRDLDSHMQPITSVGHIPKFVPPVEKAEAPDSEPNEFAVTCRCGHNKGTHNHYGPVAIECSNSYCTCKSFFDPRNYPKTVTAYDTLVPPLSAGNTYLANCNESDRRCVNCSRPPSEHLDTDRHCPSILFNGPETT